MTAARAQYAAIRRPDGAAVIHALDLRASDEVLAWGDDSGLLQDVVERVNAEARAAREAEEKRQMGLDFEEVR